MTITVLIAEAKLASSKGEARRLVDQGGVSIDGERVYWSQMHFCRIKVNLFSKLVNEDF